MTTIYNAIDNTEIKLEELSGITVVVTVPAAFSPTCTDQCVPGIAEQLNAMKDAGASKVIVVTSDQPFAINAWIEAKGWNNTDIVFASDFGSFQLREQIGKLSDEPGKEGIPQLLGNLLRRSYLVYKDGELIWKFIEPDTGSYTLNIPDLLAAISES